MERTLPDGAAARNVKIAAYKGALSEKKRLGEFTGLATLKPWAKAGSFNLQ